MAKLIAIYAGYGDTLLLQEPAEVLGPNGPPQHKYWLIDGGPITSVQNEDQGVKNTYQQYLKLALKRFCASGANPHEIDLLKGIIVTHPDMDHIDGASCTRCSHGIPHIDSEAVNLSIQVSSNS